MRHIVIALLLFCFVASASPPLPYDIYVVVWDPYSNVEGGVEVTFVFENQSHTLITENDGSADFVTSNFEGIDSGDTVTVTTKYGTKDVPVHHGYDGTGVTYNEPSAAAVVLYYAAIGLSITLLGEGIYLLRRKKNITTEGSKMSKTWYTSKTLWVNVVAIIALIAQGQFGFVIDPATQAGVLVTVNMLLRVITKEEVVWKLPDN